jgi:UDP-glucose 4-epimerase
MNVLVVGGHGFIGSHVVDHLVTRGHKVTVFDLGCKRPSKLPGESDKITMIAGDFTKEKDLENAFAGIDAVIHLAWSTTPATAERDPEDDIRTNVLGTILMLRIAIRHGIKKFIFASSGGTVYGANDIPCIAEDNKTLPICTYGVNKLTVEKFLEVFRQKYGLDYAVLRAANPYGERQDINSGVGAITKFLHCVVHGEPIEIWGDGSISRDFFYVGNLAEAFVLAMEKTTPSYIYNVGSGESRTLKEILRLVSEVTGTSPKIIYNQSRNFDVNHVCLNISRIHRELGWVPTVSLREGIYKTYKWLLGQ